MGNIVQNHASKQVSKTMADGNIELAQRTEAPILYSLVL